MQRYFAEKKEKDNLILNKESLHHIKNVMRNKIGDYIECVYQEKVYICKIISLNENKEKITEEKEENYELPLNITIAVALVKEQKMDLILQKTTELGVNRIIPLQMERSIIKLDTNKISKKQERWTTICKEASEQSKRNKVPTVEKPITLKELAKEKFDKRFICSTKENTNINKFLKEDLTGKNILFVIGPEGGITEKEEELLIKEGMQPISFGSRILRVETAAIYAASIINFCSLR